MAKKGKKQYAVFGLGRFGRSVATALQANGCQVLAVDFNQDKINEIADDVTHAVRLDVTDVEAVNSLGISQFDGAVVAIGENLGAAVMITILAKELGIRYVLAKAKDELHGKVLKKVGADSIVYPEKEMGIRVAQNLAGGNLHDTFALSARDSMYNYAVPEEWVGRTLRELNLRKTKKINVIGILRDEKLDAAPDADEPLQKGDVLVIVGRNDAVAQMAEEENTV